MSDIEGWIAANDAYLATALAWVRERLQWLRGDDVPIGWLAFRRRTFREHGGAIELPPMPQSMRDADAADRPPALVILSRRLGLSEFERNTLLLCAAMELDADTGRLCAHAQGDPARAFPTFALALRLFDQGAWDVLSPERPLRRWRLVDIHQPGGQPLVHSALKADERIVNFIKGLNYLDDRLAPLVRVVARDETPLPPSQTAAAEDVARHLRTAGRPAHSASAQLVGPDVASALAIANAVCGKLGLMLYVLPGHAVPTQTSDVETFARLWQREDLLMPVALLVDAIDVDRGDSPQFHALCRLFDRAPGVLMLASRQPWAELGGGALAFDVAKPTAVEQQAIWNEALGREAGAAPRRLGAHFNLEAATIRAIAGALVAAPAGADANESLEERLWSDCLRRARPAFGSLAQPLEPKAKWAELQLPAAEKTLLRQIADQVEWRSKVYDEWGFRDRMNRGLGISALFAGESGTGKTMAAEVIAGELRLPLYRIDLSACVSKYIGETEKNLRRVFDAAEDGGAILFFDEADALFGKRSEVKDSHDRYANIEIDYLLQRMEAFRGLAILATNMKSALDGAFLRRLRFVVQLPFPGPAERLAIWQNAFPPKTRTQGLDPVRLARLNLTGGSIHKIALNAAFLAARSGGPVTMPLIFEAARSEYRTLEKPINEADFRWVQPAAQSADAGAAAGARSATGAAVGGSA